MGIIGIDGNYIADIGRGAFVGAAYVGLSSLNSAFALSVPNVPVSFGTTVFFLVTCIAAPIAEEVIFRGGIQKLLEILFKNVYVAAILQAGLFSLFHYAAYGGGALQLAFIGAFTFGILATVLAKKTDSLATSMILHAIVNFFIVKDAFIQF